jgi:hypothetical protein
MKLPPLARYFSARSRRSTGCGGVSRSRRSSRSVRRRRELLYLERLESRELLSGDAPFILSAMPGDGSTLTTGQPTLVVQFSEAVVAAQAQNAANYLLFSSGGRSVPVNSAAYDSASHEVTLTYNGGQPLTADQYSLFVRGDQIHDVDDNLPLAQSKQLMEVNAGAADVSVIALPGNGTVGGLTNYASTGSTPKPVAAVVAQLSNNPFPDLIVVNSGANNVEIFRGVAAGVFETTPSTTLLLPSGADPQSLLVASLANPSGLPDIAVADLGTNSVTVFLNNGQGQFGAGNSFAAGNAPVGLVAGNFTGRGLVDLAVVDSMFDSANLYDVTILPADPANKGKFLAGVSFDTGLVRPSGIAVGTDLKGNPSRLTTADLVVSASNGARILVNNTTVAGNPVFGQGTLLTSTPTTSVAVGALDFSNRPDIVATTDSGGGQVLVFQNASGGLFSSALSFAANSNPSSVALGDLNGDGLQDIIVSNDNNPATGNVPGTVTVLLNTTTSSLTFGKPTAYIVDANPTTVAVHVNSQSHVVDEVVTANLAGNDASVLPSKGDGTLSVSTDFTVPSGPGDSIVIGDLTGDHLPDIVVGSAPSATVISTSTLTIYLAQPGGGYAAPITVNVGTSLPSPKPMPLVLAVADLTGSGRQDILVGNPSDGTLTVVTYFGNALFAPMTPIALSTNSGMAFAPTGIAVGDFRHTGHIDVAVAHVGAKSGVTFLAGNGNGTFAKPSEISGTFSSPAAIAAADFNNDGNLDLAVVEDKSAGDVVILLGNGKGTFTKLGAFNAGTNPNAIAIGDLNGDGFPDIAVTDKSGNNLDVTVLLNMQGAQFTTLQPYPTGQHLLSASGASLTSIAITNINSSLFPAIVVGIGGAVNTLAVVQSEGGTQYGPVRFYVGSGGGTVLGPSFLAVSGDSLVRATTFTVSVPQVLGSLVDNGSFNTPDLTGESGTIAGWSTFAESGSHGQWTGQTGTSSPLSTVPVAGPPVGNFAAMLDEPDLVIPQASDMSIMQHMINQQNLYAVNGIAQQPGDYQGMHLLYQDITIPTGATNVTLTFDLYINNTDPLNTIGYTNPLQTPGLDYFPNQFQQTPNQQVRVDIIDPSANLTDVGSGVLRNLFMTTPTTARNFGSYRVFTFDVTAFAGRTIRLRFAAVNNLGKLIVGVDNVQVQASFVDTTPPGLNNVRLRNPGSGATATFGGNTTDPTILGQVTDKYGVNNIAYVQFDLQNSGTTFSNGQTSYRINDFDVEGNFSSTLPLTLPGIYTVGITVVSRNGNTSRSTFTFNYQGPSLTNWQAVGPTSTQYDNTGVGYSTVSGDITSIALDPRDPNGSVIYVGTDNGGVWKTTDGGADWTPLTDYVTDPNGGPVPISIGGVAVDPANPNNVYAATGDANDETSSQPGIGVLKSTDGGLTWTLVGANVFADSRISKIAVSVPGPDGLTSIYVAVASGGAFGPGIYRSKDGGMTWTNVMDPTKMFLDGGGALGAGTALASATDLVLDTLSKYDEDIWVGLGNIGLVAPSDTAGVWKSPDGGNTWIQVVGGHDPKNGSVIWSPDNNNGPTGVQSTELPSASDYPGGGGLAIGRVTIALAQSSPQVENTMYVLIGTPPAGQGTYTDPNQKSENDVGLPDSFGLFKSKNGGLSWTHVMLRENVPNPVQNMPRNWLNLFTMGHDGTDAGALAVDPNDPNVVYVGGSTRYLEANDQMEGPRAHGFIRVDTSNMRDTDFFSVEYPPMPLPVVPNDGDDIIKAGDGPANSVVVNMGMLQEKGVYNGMGAPAYSGEGVFWYDLETTDAGEQNTNLTYSGQVLIPAVIHSLVFDPLGRLLIGTEGGIYRGVSRGWTYDTTDGGAGADTQAMLMPPMQLSSQETALMVPTPTEPGMVFTDLNSNLQIADITSVAIDPNNRGTLDASQASVGWIQTNGSLEWSSTQDALPGFDTFAFAAPYAGDIRTGPATPGAPQGSTTTVYRTFAYTYAATSQVSVSYQNGEQGTFQPSSAGINFSLSAGLSFTYLSPPLIMNSQKLLGANGLFQDEILFGTDKAFETDNGAVSWDQVSQVLTPGDAITAMAFGPGQDVFYVGTRSGQVFVDLNGANGGGFINRSGGLPGGPVNGITVDPNDPNTAYVMLGGSGGHVFQTTDGGMTWTDVSGDLPDFPAYSMVIDPRSQPGAPNGKIYLGTQVGVYVSTDSGASWTRFGNGMPNVVVKDLQFNQNYEELVAGTLGRGVFMISTQFTGPNVTSAAPSTPAAPGLATITVTFDHPVDPRTFTPSSIQSLTGPGGPITVLAVNDMDPVNHETYQIVIPAQILDGVYSLTIGSSIQDFEGNSSTPFSTQFVVNSTDNGRFVTGLYHDLLSRTADTNGFLGLDSSLDALRPSLLPSMAQAFVTSNEARADTIYNGAITAQHPTPTGYYETLLGRAASPSEIAVWLQDLNQGATPEQIIAAIASSLEFFQVTGGNDSAFINALYTNLDILGRGTAPSSSELSTWLGVLSQAELTARSGIVSAVLQSDEYRTLLITTFYNTYLGRPASAADISNWLPQLQRGLTDESLIAAIVGSDEYFADHGSTDASWLNAVFNDLLGRAPDPSGQANFLAQLQAGVSRTTVALELLTSAEYRTDLIQADFAKYLARAASSADVASFLSALQNGATDEAVVATIVSSPEFYADQAGTATTLAGTDANWVNAVYQDVLGRPADSGGSANFLQTLGQAESSARAGVVQVFVSSAEYRANLVTRTYLTDLGRAPSAQEISSWMPLLSQASGGPGTANPDELFQTAVLSSSEYFFGPQQRDTSGVASSAGWITSLYSKVLGRAPDSAGLSTALANILNSYQPQRLADATTLDTSTEYRTDLVISFYQTYLRRSPSQAEIAAVVAQLASGTTDEQLISILVGSLEYYQNPKLGNSDNATWLNQAYLDILGRARDIAGSQGFLNGLNNGTLTRTQVANALLASQEYQQRLVTELFTNYLGRSPSAQEMANELSAIAAGATDEQLAAQILASDEYFQRSHPFP